jgi:hypothetical protein
MDSAKQPNLRKYFVAALVALLFGFLATVNAHAQIPTGYVKLNASLVTVQTYVDSACVDATQCQYIVTAVDSFGLESVPSNSVVATVPPTGTHTATLTWTETGTVAGYNVYAHQGPKAPLLGSPVEN